MTPVLLATGSTSQVIGAISSIAPLIAFNVVFSVYTDYTSTLQAQQDLWTSNWIAQKYALIMGMSVS